MNAGSVSAQGSYNELRSVKSLLLSVSMEEDSKPEVEEEFKETTNAKDIPLVSPLANQKQEANKEQTGPGLQVFAIIQKYIQFVNNTFVVVLVFALILIAPISSTFANIHISKW